jgi:hypothetical protein
MCSVSAGEAHMRLAAHCTAAREAPLWSTAISVRRPVLDASVTNDLNTHTSNTQVSQPWESTAIRAADTSLAL